MLTNLQEAFIVHFGAPPQHVIRAPGRVNLIGEHTDYNNGFVLPCALEQHTLVALSPRTDNTVCTLALDYEHALDTFSLGESLVSNTHQAWANYVRGVVYALQARDFSLRGCNIAITGNIPQGAGLSSSAALEVGVAKALAVDNNLDITDLTLAQVGQAAENDFVGCHCGIMDQLICTSATAGTATLIDCQDFILKPVNIPADLSLLLVNSNVRRGLVDSEYNERREQCERAAATCGVSSLRDVSLEQFQVNRQAMEPLVAKRAQHVLEENERTLLAAAALQNNDIEQLSQLMAASHLSMRNLFEITVPPVDFLVAQIGEILGSRGGVRMTGGGFGGCVVALAPAELLDDIVTRVEDTYYSHTGLHASIYTSVPAAGVAAIQ